MPADQPADPTALDRPPNAAERTTADHRVPVTPVGDADPTATLALQPSIPARQAALKETRIAVLQSRVSALEDALEAERTRRRAIVDRYERLLEERDDSGRETLGDPSLRERLRGSLSP